MFTSFWNGLFGRRTRPRVDSTSSDDEAASYPKAENSRVKLKAPKDSPFAGATPVGTGSWIVCHDGDGNPYWWNNVTGQWTYQLYSTSSFQQQHQMQHLMGATTPAGVMYPQQQQQQQFMGLQQQQQQQPWLVSPSMANQHAAPWSPAYLPEESFFENKQMPLQEPEGTWEKFYDTAGRLVWIHSLTGERNLVDPQSSYMK